MSKQYLSQHTIDNACPSDIFTLATTSTSIITASGAPNINIFSSSDFQQIQLLKNAHPLGCHHIAISQNKKRFVSVGFGGEVKIWDFVDGIWIEVGELSLTDDKGKKGEIWAVALDSEGDHVVATTQDGRNHVWNLVKSEEKVVAKHFAEYETRGGFGLAVDVSPDNTFTVTSHPAGNIFIFSSSTTRLLHSLPTQASPVRVVKFSPGSSLLAASGDSSLISLYDPKSGEQVAQLRGHEAWVTSLDWSNTGEYLVSASLDGKVKVWSVETRTCVCTMVDGEGRGLWAVRWLPKENGKAERFVTGGNGGSVGVYREATGAS